jgi:beta-glucosidase
VSSDVEVTVEIENTGTRHGSEVIQVYAHDLGGVPRRLVGFEKVHLAAGERRLVHVTVSPHQLRWWDENTGGWQQAEGEVALSVSGTFGELQRAVSIGGR